jgi:hypothetical protein
MELLKHHSIHNFVDCNKTVVFSSDYKIFVDILQKTYLTMLNDPNVMHMDIFKNITKCIYNFKIKQLEFIINGRGYLAEQRYYLQSIFQNTFEKHVTKGFKKNDDFLFFLKDNNIVSF